MSIQDCFKKLGNELSNSDKRAIQDNIEGGMTEDQAVVAQLSEVNSELENVASTVEAAGGEVSRGLDDGQQEFLQSFNEDSELELKQQGGRKVRGSFNPTTKEIKLTPNANLSTFLHETGHLFLTIMEDLADASPEIQADLDILNTWFAENEAESVVDKQELFASGFETYLFEGKAPVRELETLFARFSSWLSMVYKRLSDPFTINQFEGVQISDDVRQVMDRLVVTKEQIDTETELSIYGPLPVERLGVPPDQAAEYQEIVNNANAESHKILTSKAMKELQREKTDWWNKGLEEKEDLVNDALDAKETYQARDYLTGDRIPEGLEPAKIDSDYVLQNYGKKALKKLNRMTSKKGGVHPDEVAVLFSFNDGNELILELLSSMNKKERSEYAKAEAEVLMKEEHGDMLIDGAVKEEAEESVRNDKQLDRLLMEMRFLNRASKIQTTPRQFFKRAAEQSIAVTPVDQVLPHVHRRYEIQARENAVKLAAANDFQGAAREQHKAVRQFYLYREAVIVKDRAERVRKRLSQMKKTKYSAKKVNPDYIQRLKMLVAAYDVRKNPKASNELLSKVNRFIRAQQETNEDLIASDILDTISNWKKMSISELESVLDAAENILHIGKANSEVARAADKVVTDGIIKHTEEFGGTTPKLPLQDTITKGARSFFRGFTAIHRKFENILRQADGWQDNGPLQRAVMMPIQDAANNSNEMRDEAFTELNKIFEGHEELFNMIKQRNDKIKVGDLGMITRGGVVMLALNMGNDGNLTALLSMDHVKLTMPDLNEAVSHLTEDDLNLVENIWEFLDSFYPALAKTEQQATGIAPEKVEAKPFEINGRIMRGGYYPLQGDSVIDGNQHEISVDGQAERLKNGGAVRASSKHGATIEREGWGGKSVNLSIDGLFNHVDGVVHDITHRKAVIDADNILSNKGVKKALIDSVGQENYQQLKVKLVEIAAGHQAPSELPAFSKLLRYTRTGMAYNVMGYSLRTALVNITGVASSVANLGKARMSVAAMDYMRSPFQKTEFILERSAFMRQRSKNVGRDMGDILRNLKGNSALNSFRGNAFIGIVKMDALVSRITWLAAYDYGFDKFGNEKDAIFHAERVVARTQGTSQIADLANIENRNEFFKTFTVMYSYFNAQLNLLIEQKGKFNTGQLSKAEFVENILWIMLVPAILEELMFGTEDEEDEELLDNRWVEATISYNVSYWAGVRDVGGLFKYGIESSTPLAGAIKGAFDTAQQIEQGEADKAAVRAVITTVSTLLHLPSGVQLSKSVGYLMDLEDQGGTFNPFDFLVTGKLDNE